MGILFDGADDLVTRSDTATLQNIWDRGGSAYAWIYPLSDGGQSSGRIITKTSSPAAARWKIVGHTDDGSKMFLQLGITFDGTNGVWDTTNRDLIFNTWNHIAVTYNSDNVANNPILYVNGISKDVTETVTPVGTRVSDIGAFVGIGNDAVIQTVGFDGQITECGCYGSILTATEVSQLYNARIKHMPLQIQFSNLLACWPMDDGEVGTSADGETIKDLSENGNDGTGVNGANNTGLIWQGEEILKYRNKMYFGEALIYPDVESNRIKYNDRVFDITYIDNSNEENVYKRYFLTERR